MIESLARNAGRALITFGGIAVVWMGVTMFAGTSLIRPSTTEQRLDDDEVRIEVGVDREEHFWLWLSGHAARFVSGALLLGLGGVLIVKPWTGRAVTPTQDRGDYDQ